ncbi:GerAB/ArcD/ProY family transporter [Bacillus sp. SD075]|uniref:GerAB/ArcD/ProY family transporter n=1 Tax=Bacillus sp. SD075 TaxID=2781732 RepID=UPI001A9564CE|nr:GerAB/ArcD/ProY family transporter [Bacillus sp. SD075]MBO0999648.1 GerAB/ArcD/ProY family transporter [Bacillus sp. SD075]
MQYTLRFISIAYVIFLSVGLYAHVEIIPILLATAKRDAWVCVLLTLIFLPVWIFLLYKIVSITKKQSIIKLLKDQASSFSYYLLLLPFSLFLLINAYITAKDILIWSQLSYMQGFNSFTLAFMLLLFCLICTESGLFSIGILSSLLCPIVIFLGFFVSFANIKKKNYELLFPVFSEGYLPLAKGLIYTSLPVIELFIIIFLTPVLKKTITKKQLLLVGTFIIFLMFGPTVGAIVEFGPEQAAKYRHPAYEQWRIITIGEYFSHADFFAIFQWLSGGAIRISLYVLIASKIITKGIHKVKTIRILYAVLFACCIYSIDQSIFSNFIYEYYRPISFFILPIQISILAIYLVKNKKNWEGVE